MNEVFKRNDLNQKAINGLMVIDASMSNPNGDPDNGGKPRRDRADFGIISAESVKRKIRDLIQDKDVLTSCLKDLGIKKTDGFEILESHESKGKLGEKRSVLTALSDADFLGRFIDVRLFGCTLLNGKEKDAEDGGDEKEVKKGKGKAKKEDNKKIFRGAFQFRHGMSVAPIDVITQTVSVKTGTEDGKSQGFAPDALSVVTHGLYVVPFSYSPFVGSKNGTQSDDIRILLWMLDKVYLASSVNRSGVNVVRAYVGVHKNEIGSFNRYEFQDKIMPVKNDDKNEPSRSMKDYAVADIKDVKMDGDFYSIV